LVAENGSAAGCEHGRQPEPVPGEDRMPDGIHAAMNWMETSLLQAVPDSPAADPGGEKLLPRDDPVLPGGQPRHHLVRPARTAFWPYDVLNAVLVLHDGKPGRVIRASGATF
jgi:hypothetical protein